jgi:hypothetical protein
MPSIRHTAALASADLFAVALLLAGSIAPVLGQVSARHATPADGAQLQTPTDIPSPMLLEVRVPSWVTQGPTKWATTETGKYVCQEIRIPFIEVWKEGHRGKMRLRVIAGLLAHDRPKDVDITFSIVSDSVVVRKQLVEGFTADPISRHPRNPEAEFEFTNGEFAALYGSGRAPLVRVILDVKE